MERVVVDAVVGHVDAGRVGVQQPDQLVTGGLAGHDDAGRPAQRGLDGRPEERAPRLVVVLRFGEERRVVHGHRDRAGGPQRACVERRVQHLGAHRLDEHRQAGLLPGEPGRAVGDRGRGGHDPRLRQEPGVPLGVGALGDDREVDVHRPQRAEQAVHIAPDAAAVGRDARCVD